MNLENIINKGKVSNFQKEVLRVNQIMTLKRHEGFNMGDVYSLCQADIMLKYQIASTDIFEKAYTQIVGEYNSK